MYSVNFAELWPRQTALYYQISIITVINTTAIPYMSGGLIYKTSLGEPTKMLHRNLTYEKFTKNAIFKKNLNEKLTKKRTISY